MLIRNGSIETGDVNERGRGDEVSVNNQASGDQSCLGQDDGGEEPMKNSVCGWERGGDGIMDNE